MDSRRCKAKARSGERCKRSAIPGGFVCVMHGGASPAARAAADRRKAEAEVVALTEVIWSTDAPPVSNPIESLLRLAGRLEHAANVLGARVDTVGLEQATAAAWLRVLRELRQALDVLGRLDLERRSIELQAEQSDVIVTAFRAAVALAELLPVERDLVVRAFLDGLQPLTSGGQVVAGEVE